MCVRARVWLRRDWACHMAAARGARRVADGGIEARTTGRIDAEQNGKEERLSARTHGKCETHKQL